MRHPHQGWTVGEAELAVQGGRFLAGVEFEQGDVLDAELVE
ncbi:hypothetical protein [Streptomyces sp. bgisy084]